MVRGRTTAPMGQSLGHEITGEVIEVGDDVLFVKPGDICSMRFNIACGRCQVTVLDAADTVAYYLGHDEEAPQRIRPDGLRPGMFNSPHGIAPDDLYVVEWLIGGCITRLRRAS